MRWDKACEINGIFLAKPHLYDAGLGGGLTVKCCFGGMAFRMATGRPLHKPHETEWEHRVCQWTVAREFLELNNRQRDLLFYTDYPLEYLGTVLKEALHNYRR